MKGTKNLHRSIVVLINRLRSCVTEIARVTSTGEKGSPYETLRPNVSRYVKSVLNGFFYAFKTCLIHLELPSKLFIYSDFLRDYGRLKSFRSLLCLIQNQGRKMRSFVETVSYPDRSGRKFELIKEDILYLYRNFQETFSNKNVKKPPSVNLIYVS